MTSAPDKTIARYLARHAEPEAAAAAELAIPGYPLAVVIPARNEEWQAITRALAAIDQCFLLVLVVNAPEPEAPTLVLLDTARKAGTLTATAGNIEYLVTSLPFDILLIDKCTRGRTIAPHQGVGLARKAGADIVLQLMSQSSIARGFIHCTDADVQLPTNYFQSSRPNNVAALLYPFVHTAPPALQQATYLYEISMLYYAAGLKYAGSPYAFPTLGSCMAISPLHYARVRGFPRRNAAEDFYLLDKLAKTGRIVTLSSPVIRVAARLSDRVPFGTGVGIAKIAALPDPVTDYRFYHTEIFRLLGQWLRLLRDAWDRGGLNPPGGLAPEISAWIEHRDAQSFIAATLARCRTRAVFVKAVNDWFDGGQTVKFVHFMRDRFLPSVPLSELAGSPILQLPEPFDDLRRIRAHLSGSLFHQDGTV